MRFVQELLDARTGAIIEGIFGDIEPEDFCARALQRRLSPMALTSLLVAFAIGSVLGIMAVAATGI